MARLPQPNLFLKSAKPFHARLATPRPAICSLTEQNGQSQRLFTSLSCLQGRFSDRSLSRGFQGLSNNVAKVVLGRRLWLAVDLWVWFIWYRLALGTSILGAEMQSDGTFVTMILQDCLFGLGPFWGWLAALVRCPILFQITKIGIVIFYVRKCAHVKLTPKFSDFLFIRCKEAPASTWL